MSYRRNFDDSSSLELEKRFKFQFPVQLDSLFFFFFVLPFRSSLSRLIFSPKTKVMFQQQVISKCFGAIIANK